MVFHHSKTSKYYIRTILWINHCRLLNWIPKATDRVLAKSKVWVKVNKQILGKEIELEENIIMIRFKQIKTMSKWKIKLPCLRDKMEYTITKILWIKDKVVKALLSYPKTKYNKIKIVSPITKIYLYQAV